MYGLRYKDIRIKDQQSNSKIDKEGIPISFEFDMEGNK